MPTSSAPKVFMRAAARTLPDAEEPLDVAGREQVELADGVGDGEEPPGFAGTVQMATTPALRLGHATVAANSSTSAGGRDRCGRGSAASRPSATGGVSPSAPDPGWRWILAGYRRSAGARRPFGAADLAADALKRA